MILVKCKILAVLKCIQIFGVYSLSLHNDCHFHADNMLYQWSANAGRKIFSFTKDPLVQVSNHESTGSITILCMLLGNTWVY